jgi:hypothetical protein
MRTDRRDRCTQILELIDRCLAECEADGPGASPARRKPAGPSHTT